MPTMQPPNGSDPTPARRARRWYRRILIGSTVLGVVVFAGFLAFANSLPRAEIKLARSADGIVVLTGGASRIVDAVELLAAGRGKRLLISGVHPTTTPGDLLRVNPDFERLLKCCIDLGREATNTIGNAVETGNWVRERNFRSLIVVTSGWHMPRALIEIENEVPGVALVPFPVVSERMRDEPWWHDAPTIRLLAVEYVKYLASFMRVRLDLANVAGGDPRSRS